jgi:hypothetical protein
VDLGAGVQVLSFCSISISLHDGVSQKAPEYQAEAFWSV